jgi:hypothetical protein
MIKWIILVKWNNDEDLDCHRANFCSFEILLMDIFEIVDCGPFYRGFISKDIFKKLDCNFTKSEFAIRKIGIHVTDTQIN